MSRYRIYKNKESIMTVFYDGENYHGGEAIIGGGVRPHLFFNRKELSKFIKENKFKRKHLK